jgi:hypothetical protein
MRTRLKIPTWCRNLRLRPPKLALGIRCDLGPGIIHRVVNEIQKRYWRPPLAAD